MFVTSEPYNSIGLEGRSGWGVESTPRAALTWRKLRRRQSVASSEFRVDSPDGTYFSMKFSEGAPEWLWHVFNAYFQGRLDGGGCRNCDCHLCQELRRDKKARWELYARARASTKRAGVNQLR